MTHAPLPLALAAPLLLVGSPVAAQSQQQPGAALMPIPAPPYADIADLVIASPAVVVATIRSADRIKAAEAPGLAAAAQRYYVTADVAALIRGTAAIPARVGWLVDVTPDQTGRYPRLKKERVIAFARPVAGRDDQLQLVTPASELVWTPALDDLTRRIVREAVAPDAPPAITGVNRAFHVPGTLPGEGQTQIFLDTAGERPATLTITRRPDQAPAWSVATSEVIAADAVPPARDTLLWYRLACALPAQMPAASLSGLEPGDAAQVQADYAVVLAGLGPCRRPGDAPAVARGGTPVSADGGPR